MAKDTATDLKDGDRATVWRLVCEALDLLQKLEWDGYNFINGLGSNAIRNAERLGLFISYGWTSSGLVGDFTDARIQSLTDQAIAATPSITPPTRRYPAALMTLITEQRAIVNANQPIATGGTAQPAIDARDVALLLLQKINARIRFYYCCVSDEWDQTPEPTSVGRQARRPSSQAGSAPRSGPVGPVTFNTTALTLSANALPEHATSLLAYRQAAGAHPNSRASPLPPPSPSPNSARSLPTSPTNFG
ncbi:MAG: hypothetical protein AABP62_10885 [Planctomycetota bacterium]